MNRCQRKIGAAMPRWRRRNWDTAAFNTLPTCSIATQIQVGTAWQTCNDCPWTRRKAVSEKKGGRKQASIAMPALLPAIEQSAIILRCAYFAMRSTFCKCWVKNSAIGEHRRHRSIPFNRVKVLLAANVNASGGNRRRGLRLVVERVLRQLFKTLAGGHYRRHAVHVEKVHAPLRRHW